jgi:tetratricopeptide (TPR) repeat protein
MDRKRLIAIAALWFCILTGCNRNPATVRDRDIRAGQKYFGEHKYEDASLEFRRALQADPRSADAEYQLGLSYVQLRRWPEAYRAFRQAVGIDPQNLNARIQVAELDLDGNPIHLQDAQQQIAEILNLDKDNIAGLILNGRLALQEKKYPEAEQDFVQATELAPHDANALNFLADAYVLLKKYDEAQKRYEQAIAIDPGLVASYLNLATLYGGEGKLAEQTSTFLAAIQKNPKAPQPYLALADSYVQQQHSDELGSLFARLRNSTGDSPETSLAIAQFYLSHGQPQESRNILSDLVRRDDSNLEARKALVRVDIELKQTAEAEKLNQELLTQYPADPDALLYKGRLLLLSNRVPEAITVLQRLVHQSPEMASAHYALGLAYGQHGEVDREIESLKESLGRDPNLTQAYLALAQLYVQHDDGKLALSYANEVLKRNPRSLVALLTRANAEFLLHDSQRAEQELTALANSDPNNPEIQERLGYAQLMQRKAADAASRFENALKLQPDFVPAMQDLCTLYLSQTKPDLAIARIQEQIRRAPQQAAFYDLLGTVYQSLGKMAEAENAYKGALAHSANTNTSITYARLAQVADNQHNYSQTIANAKSSIAQNPDLLPAYVLEGTAYESTGQLDAATKAYQEALARNPNFAPALNDLAWLECEHGGNLDEALSLAEHAKQVQPDDPNISDTLAWIDYRKGLYASALPLASDAAARAPTDGQFQYHLGIILLKTGNRSLARHLLKRALQLQLNTEDSEGARRALGQGQ